MLFMSWVLCFMFTHLLTSQYSFGIGLYEIGIMFLPFVDGTMRLRKKEVYTASKGWIQGVPSSKACVKQA